ncbi:MAG: efflux transporter outer membrane subunit [Myxococcota bacterium]
MKRSVLWLSASVALLMGCRLHQVEAEPPPPLTVPESFRNTGGDAEAPDRWWESFADEALNTTIDAALSDNLNIRAAWARIEQGIAVVRKQGSAYWPQLEAGLGVSGQRFYIEQPDMSAIDVSQGLDNVTLPTTTESKDAGNVQLTVSTSWEADLWGRIASMEDAALHDQLAGREDLSAVAVSLAAQVAETWFMLAEQSALLALLQQQLAANHALLELVEVRFTQGMVQAIDVRQQRQQVSSMESELPLIEGRLETLRTRLAVLIGVPPQQDITMPAAELPLPPALPATGLPTTLLTRRPDVRAARLRVTAADHRVGAAIADQFPALRLSGRIGFSDDAIDTFFLRWIYNLAANLVAPLFDGGRRSAEVARTQAVVKERVNTFGQVVLDALKEVEDALVLEARQEQHLVALQRSVEQAKQTLQNAKARYVSGLSDYLPVLGALQTLQAAERREVSARRQRLSYRIQLHRALGGAWAGELKAHDASESAPTESP